MGFENDLFDVPLPCSVVDSASGEGVFSGNIGMALIRRYALQPAEAGHGADYEVSSDTVFEHVDGSFGVRSVESLSVDNRVEALFPDGAGQRFPGVPVPENCTHRLLHGGRGFCNSPVEEYGLVAGLHQPLDQPGTQVSGTPDDEYLHNGLLVNSDEIILMRLRCYSAISTGRLVLADSAAARETLRAAMASSGVAMEGVSSKT